MPVGFNAEISPRPSVQENLDASNYLIKYDNELGLDIQSATHHVFTSGATGTGKTASVVLPLLEALMRMGHGGIIIDIKNNLTAKVRALAKKCGRLDDIVELGSYPSAIKFNMLGDMSLYEVHSFFEEVVTRDFNSQTGNMDFHSRGLGHAQDLAELLRYCMEEEPELEPTLHTYIELWNNYTDVQKIYAWFLEHVYDSSNPNQRRLVEKVEADDFHIFNDENVQKNGVRVSDHDKYEIRRQRNYNTNAFRKALNVACQAPGILDNMCAIQSEPLKISQLHASGKIVILRMSPTSGKIGRTFARILLNRYYESVFMHGESLPDGQYRFVCIDEFQDIADLSSGSYSDNNFVSKAREYRCMHITASQSCSSLFANSWNNSAVDSFLGNCLTKFHFYNDDPVTRKLASNHNPGVELLDLKPGNVAISTYENSSRDHLRFITSLNNEYRRIAELLADAPVETESVEADREFPDYHEIAKRLYASCTPGEQSAKKAPWLRDRSESGSRFATSNSSAKKEANTVKKSSEKGNVRENPINPVIKDPWNFFKQYPQLFSNNRDLELNVPVGWKPIVEKHLAAYAKSGLTAKITTFHISGSPYLRFRQESDHDDCSYEDILAAMLEETRNFCPICGKRLSEEEKAGRHAHSPAICNDCLGRPSHMAKNYDGDDDDNFDFWEDDPIAISSDKE